MKPFTVPDGMSPAQAALAYLNDTSHHIVLDDETRDLAVMLDKWRDKPWCIMTPRGTYESRQLAERWIVPRLDGGRDDVFWLDRIIWCSDDDGWVAKYTERRA